jgi:rod shape-determining protein MreC
VGRLDEDVSPLFPKGLSINVKVALFVLLSLGLMFLDNRYHLVRPIQPQLFALTTPIQSLAQAPHGVFEMLRGMASRSALAKQNRSLEQEQLILHAKLQKLVALESENRRLRALLQSSRTLDDRMLIAEITNTSTDPYRHNLTLNKGTNDSVYVGQAVVDAYGIMGQIVEARQHSAVALLITDPNHGIPVEISRNDLRTIAHGAGEANNLSLPYLPSNADIKVGDNLVSSGLGGRFPAGYPVGTVTEIRHQPGEHFLDISAAPAAHLDRGREVLLVWHQDEQLEEGLSAPKAAAAAPKPAGSSSQPKAKAPAKRP